MQISSSCSRKGTLDTQRYFCIFGIIIAILLYVMFSRESIILQSLEARLLKRLSLVVKENYLFKSIMQTSDLNYDWLNTK